MASLRAALVGFGMSGQTFHAPMIDATSDLELTSIVTSNSYRAELAHERFPLTKIFANVDALLREDTPDVVVVATPNDSHRPVALQAIGNGCAVVIDKPMALTAVEGQELVEAARQHGVMLTVFQNRRWDGDHLTLSRLVADRALGEIWRYDARYEFYRPGPGPDRTNGLLLGLGSHIVDQALHLFGPAKHVYGEVRTRIGDKDDDSFLAITHANGVYSHLAQSSRAQRFGPRLRVIGSTATFEVTAVDGQQQLLERDGKLPPLGDPTEPEGNYPYLVRDGHTTRVTPEPGRWSAFYPAVVSAIVDGSPPPVDPNDAVDCLLVMEAARQSSATATLVTL